jgi:hypothetical protein
MLEVTSAEYVEGYKIRIEFNDGAAGVVDLADTLWGPVFEPLKDIAVFRRFTVSEVFRTLCWESGADLAPEFLYEKLVQPPCPAHAAAPDR